MARRAWIDRIVFAVLLGVIVVAGTLTARHDVGVAWLYACYAMPVLVSLALVNGLAWRLDHLAAGRSEAAPSPLWPRQRGRLRAMTYGGLVLVAGMTTVILLGGRLVAAILAYPVAFGLSILGAFPVSLEIFPLVVAAPFVIALLEVAYTYLSGGFTGGPFAAAVKATLAKRETRVAQGALVGLGVLGIAPGLLSRHEQLYPIACRCSTLIRVTRADGLHVRLGWPVGWWPTGVVDAVDIIQAPFGLIADVLFVATAAAMIALLILAGYRLIAEIRSRSRRAIL